MGIVSQQTASPSPNFSRPRISARIGSIAESATLAVDARAKALKAAGRPVIGFGAGEPDFPTPGYIVEAAVAACALPASHRYTPAAGV
jgi:aspartate aminotransferase